VPSSSSVKLISLDRNRLLAELRQIAGRIFADHPEVAEIRLFGSLARGDHLGTSDVDVLILLHHTAEPDPVRRILAFLPYFNLDRGSDLLVYSLAELEGRLEAGDLFINRIWSESIPLSKTNPSS
jgi:predicted nucleotidyltransferase